MKKQSLIFLATLWIALQGVAQSASDAVLQHGAHRIGKRSDAAMQHWRDSGFGQFIHWGVYAIAGGQWNGKNYTGAAEWIRSWKEMPNETYDSLYKQFNPTRFDAKQWAKQAKAMGAKYMIFTTKHHDGFCMWHSKYTDYTVANTPYQKDILRELIDAYTAEGIDVYLYFSIIDWSHPGYRANLVSDNDRQQYEIFKQFTRNQLVELLTNYPETKGLWFDGTWDKAWIAQAAWADSLGMELRNLHPGLIIGSRFRADETGKRHVDANGHLIDDYDQRFERNLPADLQETGGNDWECVMTIPENQWGYHHDWSWTYCKTPSELIKMMIQTRALDGNFVINFGPDGEGNIRKEEADIATAVGRWMSVNGVAVYGVHHSDLTKQDWGYATQNGNKIYLTVFNQPVNQLLRIQVPKSKSAEKIFVIRSAKLLANGQNLSVKGNAKRGSYYRDKFGYSYFDLILPAKIKHQSLPFVLEIELDEINVRDQDSYQQALT